MKQRKLYYRRKNRAMVVEGRLPNGKRILIWTLPDPDKLITQILQNASLLPSEKQLKIKEKYMRLAFRAERSDNGRSKVLPIKIMRTEKKDA